LPRVGTITNQSKEGTNLVTLPLMGGVQPGPDRGEKCRKRQCKKKNVGNVPNRISLLGGNGTGQTRHAWKKSVVKAIRDYGQLGREHEKDTIRGSGYRKTESTFSLGGERNQFKRKEWEWDSRESAKPPSARENDCIGKSGQVSGGVQENDGGWVKGGKGTGKSKSRVGSAIRETRHRTHRRGSPPIFKR